MNQFSIVLLGVVTVSHAAMGAGLLDQLTDPVDGRFDASQYLADNAFGFLPVPIIITEPAVDAGLGMAGLFFHEDEESSEQRRQAMNSADANASRYLFPPSVSALVGAYTGNGSWFIGGGHLGFFRDGTVRYEGGGGYGEVRLDYYSLGEVELPRPITVDTEAVSILNAVKFKLGELPLFLGPTQQYIHADLSLKSPLADSGIPDPTNFFTQSITTSSLGAILELDTRDNIFTPTQGFHYELEYKAFREEIGSDIDYDSVELEGLNYVRLAPRWRLGVRVGGEVAKSDEPLPPFALPTLSLRGIPAARYQGSHIGVVETEVTWEVDSRWSILGFAGAGRAANSSEEFKDSPSRVSRGAGFRYLIARRYGFHMGVDLAEGPEDTVLYIQAGSAW